MRGIRYCGPLWGPLQVFVIVFSIEVILKVYTCGNFDIILVHLTRDFPPSTTPLVPCDVFYLVPMLIGC